jgi:hypothetical protein
MRLDAKYLLQFIQCHLLAARQLCKQFKLDCSQQSLGTHKTLLDSEKLGSGDNEKEADIFFQFDYIER